MHFQMVMKNIPMGITYASFAGLCILATSVVGVIKYGQIPNYLRCWYF